MTSMEIEERVRELFPDYRVTVVWARPLVCMDCPEKRMECLACLRDPSMQPRFAPPFGVELRMIPILGIPSPEEET